MDADWQDDLGRWLAPYVRGLGNKARRRMCPASHRLRPRRCLKSAKWRQVSWRPGTKRRRVACYAALPVRIADAAQSASALRARNPCPVRMPDWWASFFRTVSENSISQTCQQGRRSRTWSVRSRHVGSASRRISISRNNPASITSKAVPGPVSIARRS